MMGPRQVAQGALFYEFSIEDHVPQGHVLRAIDPFVDLAGVRWHLAPFYSSMGRLSVDPELMIRMLLVGYRTHTLSLILAEGTFVTGPHETFRHALPVS